MKESVSGRQLLTEGPACGRPRAGDDAVHGRNHQGGAARAPHRAEPVQANDAGGVCGIFKHMHHEFDNVTNSITNLSGIYILHPHAVKLGLRCSAHTCMYAGG